MPERSHFDMSVIMAEAAPSGSNIKVLVMQQSNGRISGTVFVWKTGVPTYTELYLTWKKMLKEM